MTEEEKALELAIVAPELSRAQINELCSGRRYEDYRKAKYRYLFSRAELAIARQWQWHQNARNREMRFVDGIGQQIGHIEDEFFSEAMRLRYGRDCWSNKDKREFIYKKFPFLRMPAPAPRVRVNGFRHNGAAPAAAPRHSGERKETT